MAKYFLLSSLGILLTFTIGNSEVPKQYTMSDNCGSTISFSDSMVLTSENMTSASCNIAIQSNDVNNRLLINFVKFEFIDNCTDTRLSVLDDFGNPISGPLCEDNLNVTVFKSGGNIAHFQYISDVTDNQGASFSAIITSFNVGIRGNCTAFEFQCANKLCISKNLVCNSFDECSDNSDETLPCHHPSPSPSPSPGTSPGVIAGSVIGSLVGVVVITVVVGWFVVKKRRPQHYGTI